MLMIKGKFCSATGDGREIFEDLIKAIITVHTAVAKREGKEFADKLIVEAGREAMNSNHDITEIISESWPKKQSE